MGAADALTLENWLVTPGGIRVRPGKQTWATGLGTYVESLMPWFSASGNNKLFAAVPNNIYDVTAQAAVGPAVQTGLSNGRWQHTNFATPGGQYLVLVNGSDAPRHYNGTIWTSPVITGTYNGVALNANNFIHVEPHVGRLWFVEKSTLRGWYLPVLQIAGTATPFDLGPFCSLGGELLASASWTVDGGQGPDDYAAFITSRGQVVVYQGTDPDNAATWQLRGIYKIPEPLGRRCTYKLGGELIILTIQGPIALSQAMSLSETGQANQALTTKIGNAWRQAAEFSSASFGWQVSENPRYGFMVMNVPVRERVQQDQYVFSTQTGAWSKFTGLNAGCFAWFGTAMFFGGNDGTVYRLDGVADLGLPILASYQHAFTDLRSVSNKRLVMARPRIVAPPSYLPAVHIKTDLDTSPVPYRTIPPGDAGPAWDVTAWDEAYWGADSVSTQGWQGVEGIGTTVSVAFRVAATAPVMLNGVDLTYEVGGLL
jgi:hypothetical protein